MEPYLAHSVANNNKPRTKVSGKIFHHPNREGVKVNSGLPYSNQGGYEGYSSQGAVSRGYERRSGSAGSGARRSPGSGVRHSPGSGVRRSTSSINITKTITETEPRHNHRSTGRRHHHGHYTKIRRHHSYVENTDFGQDFIFIERDGRQRPPHGYEYRGKLEIKGASTRHVYRTHVPEQIRYIQSPPIIQQVPVPYIQHVPVPHTQHVPVTQIQHVPVPYIQQVPVTHYQQVPVPYIQQVPVTHYQQVPVPYIQQVPIPYLQQVPIPFPQPVPYQPPCNTCGLGC
ncbi:unnamed protein product [Didymodactylos carnosus]|uniref:Uncharacterized protein n=1 Tax=Didymodactylos carnosus TaxID=1234261 RepID=A0A814U5U3_9BILA|nr:unnamed protein product [Didymodactylos carnosus]CAF1170293.1 unnamed protein product [Didymodactylos carnosus]CAF3808320.1 unnamed protein product [Didymodactylos carnosus]CAF3933976.1 unnamed protein product [Didymodactylos carnosus]